MTNVKSAAEADAGTMHVSNAAVAKSFLIDSSFDEKKGGPSGVPGPLVRVSGLTRLATDADECQDRLLVPAISAESASVSRVLGRHTGEDEADPVNVAGDPVRQGGTPCLKAVCHAFDNVAAGTMEQYGAGPNADVGQARAGLQVLDDELVPVEPSGHQRAVVEVQGWRRCARGKHRHGCGKQESARFHCRLRLEPRERCG